MSVALKEKVRDLDREIESKKSLAKEKWSAFDKLRTELADSDVDITDESSEGFIKAHEAHGEYGEIADQVEALGEQRQKLWAMVGERGEDFDSPGEKLAARKVKDGLRSSESYGAKVVANEAYKALRERGAFTSSGRVGEVSFGQMMDRGELHSVIVSDPDGSNTVAPFIEPDHRGLVEPKFRPLVIMDLITTGTTDSDSVDYIVETGWTNNAKGVAEASTDAAIGGSGSGAVTETAAGLKPQSALSYEKKDAAVKTLAHWVAMTKKSLADVARLQSTVDNRLRRGLLDVIEDGVIAGDGVDENLKGILATTGVQHQDRSSDPLVEDLLKAMTKVRLAYFEPNAVGLNPLDFQEIRLQREGTGTGTYIYGPPSQAGPTTIWGVQSVQAPQFVEDQPIVGDFKVVEYYVREGVQVMASDSHADFFTRNLVALLAETRGVVVIPQPEGLCEVSAAAPASGSGSGS